MCYKLPAVQLNGSFHHHHLVSSQMLGEKIKIRAAPILVSVLVSGQYQHNLMVSELVKYIIQVPILLFMQYYP